MNSTFHAETKLDQTAFEAVIRTDATVRGALNAPEPPASFPKLMASVLLAVGTAFFLLLHSQIASADASADTSLLALTNQDRTSNGLAALQSDQSLTNIGENTAAGCSPYGRATDMVNRNYFSHFAPGCSNSTATAFLMMQAAGIPYGWAGENIGWVAPMGSNQQSAAASFVNCDPTSTPSPETGAFCATSSFMGSSDHYSNIMNSHYTNLGTGSTWTSGTWGPCSCTQVWMFTAEFRSVPGSAPPPPQPGPSSTGGGSQPVSGGHTYTPPPAPTPLSFTLPSVTLPPTASSTPQTEQSTQPLFWSDTGTLADPVESTLVQFLY